MSFQSREYSSCIDNCVVDGGLCQVENVYNKKKNRKRRIRESKMGCSVCM